MLVGRTRTGLALVALVLGLTLAGCSLGGGSSSTTTHAQDAAPQPLAKLAWCDKPLLTFQDDSTTTPTTKSSWDDVKGQLGFTPYLPETLPSGTCLALAGGSIHDPVFGGHFDITYVLPNLGPVSFSEAPKKANLPSSFQCVQGPTPSATPQGTSTATATPAPRTTTCLGVQGDTAISLASRESQANLQTLFKSLKPNVTWVPTGTSAATPSPSASATGTTVSH